MVDVLLEREDEMGGKQLRKTLDKQLLSLPKKVKFCKLCVISNQRPRIFFDNNGICGACRHDYRKKHEINWSLRKNQLEQLCDKYRRKDGGWDVLVPGSGGKDSAYVAHVLKHEYGMHPLTATWVPFKYTDIGYKNYINFVDAGFTNIQGHPNGKLHRKLARICFEEVGDNFHPFIWGQHGFVFNTALKYDIKLVFYGENGSLEYGGNSSAKDISNIQMEDHVVNVEKNSWKGATVNDVVKYGLKYKDYFTENDFTQSDLLLYSLPSVNELRGKGMQMHYMSYYHKWDPQENFYYASEHTGYQANPVRSEGTYSKYASLDDKLDGFHFYLMFIKFGIGRATSDAAHEIRDGHITRDEGVSLVKRYDEEFPTKYFEESLEYLDVDEAHFLEIVDSFRLPHVWVKTNGEWKLRHTVSQDGVDD